jgi:hypothetical protein
LGAISLRIANPETTSHGRTVHKIILTREIGVERMVLGKAWKEIGGWNPVV